MGARLDKCKAHFVRNKKFYAGIGLGILAGGTAVYLTKKTTIKMPELPPIENNGILNNIGVVEQLHSHTHILNEDPVKRLSYITKVEDQYFETQREAAKFMGVSELHLSKFLNGKSDMANLNGYIPERVGVRAEG
jgi:hypothetical protein